MKPKKTDNKKIYLDACVLIAYFSGSKEEVDKKKIIQDCLQYFETLEGIRLFTSHWALSEMTNILIARHKMKTPKVRQIEEEFSNTERLGKVKVRLLDASPLSNYTVKEFLYEVRSVVLKHHPGLGDSMHSVIMKNYEINTILTFDLKGDFTAIPGLTVLDPKDFVKGFKSNP